MSFSDDGYDQHACKLVGSAQSNLDIELGELRRRPMGKGDRFIFTTIISATAHAKPFKANNSLNQSPLPRHRGVPLRRLEPPFQSIRAGKINLSPLFDSKGRSSPINEILDSIPPLILPPGFEEACEINPTMFGCPKPKIPMC